MLQWLALFGVLILGQSGQRKEAPSGGAEAVFAAASASVVVVTTNSTQGSGVVVGDGEVVTNYHVIRDAIGVVVSQGDQPLPATIAAVNPKTDLALLRVAGLKNASVVRLRTSGSIRPGERVYAIGAPKGFELTISEGLVSGRRELNGTVLVQTSAPLSPGSSGGGLFDAKGVLIAITTAAWKDAQNLNFGVPAEQIQLLRSSAVTSSTGLMPHGAETGSTTMPQVPGGTSADCEASRWADCVVFAQQALRTAKTRDAEAVPASYLEKGCRSGHTASCLAVGAQYFRWKELTRAKPFLAAACMDGSAEGCVTLAAIHLTWGTDTDLQRARELAAKACALGEQQACQLSSALAAAHACENRCQQELATCRSQCFGYLPCKTECTTALSYCRSACR